MKVMLEIKSCRQCPFNKEVNTGRESFRDCTHPEGEPYIGALPKGFPKKCPLRKYKV